MFHDSLACVRRCVCAVYIGYCCLRGYMVSSDFVCRVKFVPNRTNPLTYMSGYLRPSSPKSLSYSYISCPPFQASIMDQRGISSDHCKTRALSRALTIVLHVGVLRLGVRGHGRGVGVSGLFGGWCRWTPARSGMWVAVLVVLNSVSLRRRRRFNKPFGFAVSRC